MSYKSQLKAWATEIALKYHDAAKTVGLTLEQVLEDAEKLVGYTYNPRKDLEDHAASLFELLRTAPPDQASIDAIMGTLEHIKHDRIAQGIDKPEATNE